MTTATAAPIKLVYADEVGSRIAGFTVRSVDGVELCETVQQLDEIGATAWADSVELLIWLSRTPKFWGDFTTSAQFLVWNQQSQSVHKVTVPRKGCELPFDREQLR